MAIAAATSFAAKQPHTLREFSQFIYILAPTQIFFYWQSTIKNK